MTAFDDARRAYDGKTKPRGSLGRLEDLGCGRHLGHDFFRHGLDAHAFSVAAMNVLTDNSIKKGVSAMSKAVWEYVQNRGPAEVGRALAAHSTLQ